MQNTINQLLTSQFLVHDVPVPHHQAGQIVAVVRVKLLHGDLHEAGREVRAVVIHGRQHSTDFPRTRISLSPNYFQISHRNDNLFGQYLPVFECVYSSA